MWELTKAVGNIFFFFHSFFKNPFQPMSFLEKPQSTPSSLEVLRFLKTHAISCLCGPVLNSN
jgi:hypothetical protein